MAITMNDYFHLKYQTSMGTELFLGKVMLLVLRRRLPFTHSKLPHYI